MDCPSGTWGEGCANVCQCNWSTTDTCDEILLENNEDPTCTDRRGNSAIQLMILWNRIGKDIYQSYRDTLRLMIKKARELYGKNVINKLFDNGETILHTAVIKAEEASVEILIDLGAEIFATN